MFHFTYSQFDLLTPDEQEMFRTFLHFAVENLLQKEKKSKKLYRLHFEFESGLSGLGELEVESDDEPYTDFRILFSKRCRKKKLISTLLHELVHVKQYCRKELNFGSTMNHTHWKGKLYDERKLSYWLLPWEIEAYGLEKCLYELCLDSNRDSFSKRKYAWVLK
jgi:hypothetical protein